MSSLKMTDVMVMGEGPLPCEGMLIGQNPGADEVRMLTEFGQTPRPFIGQAGIEQEEYLAQVGLNREQLYITNAYKRYTIDNRRPEKWEFEDHRDILIEEIRMCQPKVIGGVGVEASQELSWASHQTFRDMASEHGIPRYVDLWGHKCVMVPLTHPAAGLHSPSVMGVTLWDYQRFAQTLKGEIGPTNQSGLKPITGDVTSVLHLDEIIINHSYPYIYIDTEGDKNMPWGLTFSVDDKCGWRVGVERQDLLDRFNVLLHGLYVPEANVVPKTFIVVCHHSIHDIPVLLSLGIDIRDLPIRDTMMMAYNLCVEPQGLKALGWRWVRYDMTEYGEQADPVTEGMTQEYVKRALEVDWDKCTVCGREDSLGKKHHHLTQPIVDGAPLLFTGDMGFTPWLTHKGNIKKKYLPYVNWCTGGEKGGGNVPLNKRLRKIYNPPSTYIPPPPDMGEISDDDLPF